MAISELVEQMKSEFKTKYSYLSDEQVDDLYNCSRDLYLSLTFPLDRSITDIPEDYARDVSIVRLIMQETLEREGMSSYVAYSENGMSFSFDNAHISAQILSLITPKAKVVTKGES